MDNIIPMNIDTDLIKSVDNLKSRIIKGEVTGLVAILEIKVDDGEPYDIDYMLSGTTTLDNNLPLMGAIDILKHQMMRISFGDDEYD